MSESATPELRAARGRLWRAELDGLGVRVLDEALDHLSHWAVPLSPSPLSLPESGAGTDLSLTIDSLVQYARTGRGPDWDDPGSAEDALLSVSILYDAPLGDPTTPADWLDERDPPEGVRADLAEVARACLARARIARGEPVPRSWLAALAGLSLESITKAVGEKKLKLARARTRDRGRPARDIEATSARAWLVARGVEGL